MSKAPEDMKYKELKNEKKRLENEIKDNYRIFNFLTYKQREHLERLFARVKNIEREMEISK